MELFRFSFPRAHVACGTDGGGGSSKETIKLDESELFTAKPVHCPPPPPPSVCHLHCLPCTWVRSLLDGNESSAFRGVVPPPPAPRPRSQSLSVPVAICLGLSSFRSQASGQQDCHSPRPLTGEEGWHVPSMWGPCPGKQARASRGRDGLLKIAESVSVASWCPALCHRRF